MVIILAIIVALGSLISNERANALESTILPKEKTEAKDIVYKILTPEEWDIFQKEGTFKGSTMDQRDGFIHAALPDQYPGLVEKFFKDIRPIVIVKLNTILLKPGALKIESNRPGGDEYPHIYGHIPYKAIMSYEIVDK